MAKLTIAGTDTVNAALVTKCVSNFTELYNYLTGVSSPTLLTPTIASFANATHSHSSGAGGGGMTAPVISSPLLSGTATGTYTLGGTPTITLPTITLAAFKVPTLGTGLGAYGSTRIIRYNIDPMSYVSIEGAAYNSGGTINAATTLFTLDSGYRPSTELSIPVVVYQSGGFVSNVFTITTAGVVKSENLNLLNGASFFMNIRFNTAA